MVVAVQPGGVLSVSLTASPTSASTGTPLTFTAAVSPSDAAITLFSWNFGDGTTRTTTGGTTSHVYGDGGTYTATVTVTAADGRQGSGLAVVAISDLAAIDITLTASPTTGAVSSPTTFTVAGTTGLSVTEYSWSFGDGDTRSTSGSVTTHIYSAVGTWTTSRRNSNRQSPPGPNHS